MRQRPSTLPECPGRTDRGSAIGRIARLRGRLVRHLREWRQRRRLRITGRILRGLDDRTLKDIGLDRSQIDSAVHALGRDRRVRFPDVGGWG